MLEIILAAIGAVVCLGYILSSAASEQTQVNKGVTESKQADAPNIAA